MDFKFSIHNIFNVSVTNLPERTRIFLEREFQYFKVNELDRINLEIRFVKKIKIPPEGVYLLKDLFYKSGIFYLNFSGSILRVPLKDVNKKTILILSERKIPAWMIFYAIEKILHMKILEKDFCFFHAAGVKEEEKVVIYSSLQTGGKTKWVLENLRNNCHFLGDDLILVNRSGYVFSYPRGININKYHGTFYKKVLMSFPKGAYVKHRISILILYMLRCLFQFCSGVKRRMDNLIEEKSIFRVNIRQVFPDVKIVNNNKLDKIIIVLKSDTKQQSFEKWKLKRIVNFLLINTNYERLAHAEQYIQAFLAYGDDYSFAIREYIAKLIKKEARTVCRIIKKCEVETVINPD